MRINTRNILRITLVLALFASAMVLTGCSQESPKGKEAKLNLFTWEGMFPQDVLDEFTAETGIAINYSNFDYNETMLAKLEAAKGGDYDLVIADDYILETVFAEGLAQKPIGPRFRISTISTLYTRASSMTLTTSIQCRTAPASRRLCITLTR